MSSSVGDLLQSGRRIWGRDFLTLDQIIVRINVGLGDLARRARDSEKDSLPPAECSREIKKELGNLIFSTIRWCDDLGYDPEECIALAESAQAEFAAKNKKR